MDGYDAEFFAAMAYRRGLNAGRKTEDENAKLRELCRDMYRRFHGVVIENWAYSSEDFRMYERRMRELGIEVE